MAGVLGELREVFCEALDQPTPDEQSRYLDRVCAGRPDLRARVEELLRAQAEAGGFLRETNQDGKAGASNSHTDGPGAKIGPYTLLEPMGEGGMGVVWRAEQHAPVRRSVALKILKAGLDSKAILARFEAERQALAVMDHHYIAKVHDAGATAAGRPYFAMELVQGVPITRYCDEHRLSPRQRLELFIPVCQAIQHAHTKGIIHRDIKPSNVLVGTYDGLPVPKVIDFGIAKATGQRLTDETIVTGFGQVLGTLEYMSPEQAEFNAHDIDTRSDIYSLGVLLYELLTGTTPLGHQRARETPLPELLRVIREEEAPSLSTRLGCSETLVEIAAVRQTEPVQLAKLLRGELDWIVLKALEKDRTRRYETATGLAKDLERYLHDEPVEACPPSTSYRLRKFARRHARALITVAAFTTLVLGGGALAGWQAIQLARTERDQANQRAQRSYDVEIALNRANEIRQQARSSKLDHQAKWAEALALANRAEALVESGPVVPELGERVGALRRQLDREQKDRRMVAELEAIRFRQADLQGERFDTRGADQRYAALFRDYGLDFAAKPELAVRQLQESDIRADLLAAMDNWIWSKEADDPALATLRAVADGADDDQWRRELRQAAGRRDSVSLLNLTKADRALEQPPSALALLGEALQVSGRPDEAAAWLRRAQQRHSDDFWLNHHLAYVLFAVMRPPQTAEAVGYFRGAVALNPDNAGVHFNLGNALRELGNLPAAIASYRRALDLNPRYAPALVNLGITLRRHGDLSGAAEHFQRALELAPSHALARANLGIVFQQQGDWPRATDSYRQAIAADPNYAEAHNSLGAILDAQGDVAGAAACFHKALECDPTFTRALFNLGIVAGKQGDLAGAATYLQRGIDLTPEYEDLYFQLSRVRQAQHDFAGALAPINRLLALKPLLAQAHYRKGHLMGRMGDKPAAIGCYRTAVSLEPTYAEAHCDLGNALIHVGEFREALVALRTGHELGSKRSDWRNASADWVKECERWLQLEKRLPAILQGKEQPANSAERIEFADLCRYKNLNLDSVRLFQQAFAADASLTARVEAGHRYRAAGAAVLAANGKGDGAARLDEAERATLRRQALGWLRADLTLNAQRLEAGTRQHGQAVCAALTYWQHDATMRSVREAEATASLSDDDRAAWKQLWADVATLCGKAKEQAKR